MIRAVYAAREDSLKADELIASYIPFIRVEASRATGRICTQEDDAYSIAMMAFYEAIMSYDHQKGAFLSFAALCIRSRILDFLRKEERHRGHLSLDAPDGSEDDRTLLDKLPDDRDHYEASANREATRQEIEELAAVMHSFGISFSDVAADCPRQQRTLDACATAIRCAGQNRELLHELLRTRKLPLTQLTALSGVERKTLERHRKYVLAMLLVQTNGYEIIRGHLYRILRKGGRS